MKLLTSLIMLLGLNVALAEVPTLENVIKTYPSISEQAKDADFGMLFMEIQNQSESYKFFYEGPEDDGTESEERREWREIRSEISAPAYELAQHVLDTYRSEDINFFQLEMMKRYLDEPESRPAIQEVMQAFGVLKFNPAYYDAIENQKDTLPHVGTGALGGFGIAMVACAVRPKSCRELVKKGQLAADALKETGEQAARVSRTQRIRNTVRGILPTRQKSKVERTWKELLEETPKAPRPIQAARKVKTAGGKANKMAFFNKYRKLTAREKNQQLKYVALSMGGGAVGWTALQKLKNAYQEGKWDYQELDPNELERRYFGALALLEMSCEAKLINKQENLSYQQIRDYALSMQEELIILSRLSGGLEFYDKVPLEFVTPLPETEEILIQLPLAMDMPLDENGDPIGQFKRPCPGIASQGSEIKSSFAELEGIFSNLVQKGGQMIFEAAEAEMNAGEPNE